MSLYGSRYLDRIFVKLFNTRQYLDSIVVVVSLHECRCSWLDVHAPAQATCECRHFRHRIIELEERDWNYIADLEIEFDFMVFRHLQCLVSTQIEPGHECMSTASHKWLSSLCGHKMALGVYP
jgi:hypothetical protein